MADEAKVELNVQFVCLFAQEHVDFRISVGTRKFSSLGSYLNSQFSSSRFNPVETSAKIASRVRALRRLYCKTFKIIWS